MVCGADVHASGGVSQGAPAVLLAQEGLYRRMVQCKQESAGCKLKG